MPYASSGVRGLGFDVPQKGGAVGADEGAAAIDGGARHRAVHVIRRQRGGAEMGDQALARAAFLGDR